MKIRERSAAGGSGGGRAGVPAPALGAPVGERLPVAPRERKPALAALAVLLILVGALGATVLVMRAGDRVSAIRITAPVAAGEVIPPSAMTEVMVAADSDVNYVEWSQRGDVSANYRSGTDLVKGTVLVGEMLTGKDNSLAAGKVVVGLSLKQGQFPDGLKVGDTVAAYRVGNDTVKSSSASAGSAGSANSQITARAKVKSVPGGSSDGIGGSGDSAFSVVVDESDAPALTAAASAGQVALVLVPASKN